MKIINTQRLYLRSFIEDDFNSLKEMMTDEEVMRFTRLRCAQSEDVIKRCLMQWSQDQEVWACVEKESDQVIGWAMLKKTTSDDPELGFMLIKKVWSKGFATEISKSLISYAIDVLKVNKIIAFVSIENDASKKVLKKVGMKEVCAPHLDKESLYFEYIK